jgi:hypothetical protein
MVGVQQRQTHTTMPGADPNANGQADSVPNNRVHNDRKQWAQDLVLEEIGRNNPRLGARRKWILALVAVLVVVVGVAVGVVLSQGGGNDDNSGNSTEAPRETDGSNAPSPTDAPSIVDDPTLDPTLPPTDNHDDGNSTEAPREADGSSAPTSVDDALYVGTNPNDFICQFGDDESSPFYNSWLCTYNEYPYPIASALGSLLLANCTNNVAETAGGPNGQDCLCAIVLQLDPTNEKNRQQCSSCSFVTPADPDTFQIAYTCDNLLSGPCTGRNIDGSCIPEKQEVRRHRQ